MLNEIFTIQFFKGGITYNSRELPIERMYIFKQDIDFYIFLN